LSSNGFFGIIYEHFSRCILEDPSLRFSELFYVATTITYGDIPRSVALVLEASRLLAMAKDIGGLRLITIGEVFLQFISCSTILQLRGSFQEHLSPT
jgi:hypothetical protein